MVLEILNSFIVSVLAGVVSYYICKWIDTLFDNKQDK